MFLQQACNLTDSQLRDIAALVKHITGIDLHRDKRELIKARLNSRLRKLGLEDFREYINYLKQDISGNELTTMLDMLSTNVTHFYRQPEHFDYLSLHTFSPKIKDNKKKLKKMRIWSAGCSSGEEPYSIAITALEKIENIWEWDIKILATDLSTRVLARARQGVYSKASLKTIPPVARHKYFTCIESGGHGLHRIHDQIRRMVCFARLNLFSSWPMGGPFDAIFCRNVMIYFDRESQKHLIDRFWEKLAPGGMLFIGDSESLISIQHRFKYMKPSIYEKSGGKAG